MSLDPGEVVFYLFIQNKLILLEMLLITSFVLLLCSNYVLKFRISTLQHKDMQRLLTEIRFVVLHFCSMT